MSSTAYYFIASGDLQLCQLGNHMTLCDFYTDLVRLVLTEDEAQRKISKNGAGFRHVPELAVTYALEKRLADRISGDLPEQRRTFREYAIRPNRHVDLLAILDNDRKILAEVKQDCPLHKVADDGVKLYYDMRPELDEAFLINFKEEWADSLNGWTQARTEWLNKTFREKGVPALMAEPFVAQFDFVSCVGSKDARPTALVVCAWRLSIQG